MAKSKNFVLLRIFLTATACLIVVLSSAGHVIGESKLLNKPVDSQKTSSMRERIESRKKELRLDLSATAAANIESKCQAAQTKIKQLKTSDTVTVDNYYKAYGDIADRVAELIQRLSSQAVSTAGIQTALNQYVDSVNQYLVNADTYKAAVADLESMDCQADPEGFAASLADARNQRAKLAVDAEAVKTKINNISAALIGAKDKL